MFHVEMLEPRDAYALWAASYPPHAHNPVMHAEERAMLAAMPADLDGQSVLDAGCGSGRYMLHALKRHAKRVTGVDLSAEMLERASAKLRTYRHARAPRTSYSRHSGESRNPFSFSQQQSDPLLSPEGWAKNQSFEAPVAEIDLIQGSLEKLPLPDALADLTICGLAVGHLDSLQPILAELHRVTRPGGTILCSDVHPIGHALGWRRDFKSHGRHFAVRHTQHLYSHWHAACAALRLEIARVLEPRLDPADIPADAHFDPLALEVPVALVFLLRRPF